MKVRAGSGVVLAAAGVLLVGCGASDREQVRAKVQQFAVAVEHRDAKTICGEVFAPSLVTRFTSAGLTCERGLEIFFSGLRHPTLAVGRVTVHGSRASAITLSEASGQPASLRPVELVKTSSGWRIAALGAPLQPSGGSGAQGAPSGPSGGSGAHGAPSGPSGGSGAHGGGNTTRTNTTATTTKKRAVPHRPATNGSTSTSTKP